MINFVASVVEKQQCISNMNVPLHYSSMVMSFFFFYLKKNNHHIRGYAIKIVAPFSLYFGQSICRVPRFHITPKTLLKRTF